MRKAIKSAQVRLVRSPPTFTPTDVQALRVGLNLAVPAFSRLLGVSTATVRDWEEGKAAPRPCSRRLMQVLREFPDVMNALMPGRLR